MIHGRSKGGLWRQVARAATLAILAAGMVAPGTPRGARAQETPAAPGPASVTLTLPQAQMLAVDALRQGRPQLAYELSTGLLEADPTSGEAHFIQAVALVQMQQVQRGRKAAAKAYRHGDNDNERFQAAELAAKLSFADEHYTMSQLWLRRAVHYAPDDATRDRTVKSFHKVRQRNPLNFDLSFSITPSDNVNNGANSPFNVIDGSPIVGSLSPSAQAIDGIVATTNLRGSYRVLQGENHETRVTGRIYARRVEFEDPVPGLSGEDISATRAELGLSHIYGTRGGKNGYWRFSAGGGRAWYGGDPLYDFANLGVARKQRLGENLSLMAGVAIEEQNGKSFPTADATVYQAFAGLSYELARGSRIGARLQYSETDSDGTNRASDQWAGILSYAPARQIGPADVSFSVGISTLDFERYRVIFPVPGGRTDESVFGGVTASFQDWSYMGFVPTVSLRGEKSRSNISRFDVDETSLSLGIRSEF